MKATPRLLLAFSLLALLAGGCSKKKPTVITVEEPPRSTPASAKAPAANSQGNEVTPRETSTPSGPAPSTAGAPPAPASEGIPEDLAAQDAAYETWFKKHGLDLSDPKMLDDDADNDGATNREEFLADTNPRDDSSRPGVVTGIRLKEFVRKDLPFVLRNVQGQNAEIERGEEGAKKRETVKTGQPLAGSSYKVVRVQQRQTRDKDGNVVDGSRITLEDTTSKQRIDLVKDLPARSTASHAVLTSADGAKSITVHDGETFTWPGEPPVTYKVKDLRAEQVILEEVSTGKTVTVPKE